MKMKKDIPHQRQNILGVMVSAIDLAGAVSLIRGWIQAEVCTYVCVTPAHGIMDCYHQSELRKVFNQSGMTTPDGMAVVWLLKAYGHQHVGRVYGPDLVEAVCQAGGTEGWRHFFYGGAPGVADELAGQLKERFPGLIVAGTYCPPFRELTLAEEAEVSAIIQAATPDIVWVGISTPKQERWMASMHAGVGVPVMVGVGAAFDFLSGVKPQAPLWMQRSGLEWMFRLLSEPRRLWRRYIQYPKFVILAAAQWMGLLSFEER